VADIAIDLGTANTLIYIQEEGIVLNEPSVVAVVKGTLEVVAVGEEAKRMMGRTPQNIVVSRPMRDGVIADVDLVDVMLRHFLHRVARRSPVRGRPRLVIGVPSGITEMERRAVRTAVAGVAKEVFLITEPMAAAIGVGLPVTSAQGSMVVNIGGGTTEIGVIALSGTVVDASIRTAGDEFDAAIASFLRKEHNLMIGEGTAELIKIHIGSASPLEEELAWEVSGRDLVSGIPKTVQVGSLEIREALQEPISAILGAVRRALEFTPPELASDMIDSGITLTGGGARLRGIAQRMKAEIGLPIAVDPDPLTCVVRGAGMVLDDWATYRDVVAG
jgi:rod shape-determining protein MreB